MVRVGQVFEFGDWCSQLRASCVSTPKAVCLAVLGFLYACILGNNPFISTFDFFFLQKNKKQKQKHKQKNQNPKPLELVYSVGDGLGYILSKHFLLEGQKWLLINHLGICDPVPQAF